LPIGQPDPIPKKTWRKRDAHGKADRRALTAAEIAEQDLKLRERENKKQRPNTPKVALQEEDTEIQVPATPEREPPTSTAPARLIRSQRDGEGEGRGKRKHKATDAYREARQAGLKSLGYSQVEQ
jgi:hypothetical protein